MCVTIGMFSVDIEGNLCMVQVGRSLKVGDIAGGSNQIKARQGVSDPQ